MAGGPPTRRPLWRAIRIWRWPGPAKPSPDSRN
jgi:hypothetical protein